MANVKARDCVYTNELEIEQNLTELRSWLLAYCTGLTGCNHDGEDVVQEVLFRALPVICGQSRHPNVKAYLLQIAKNVWIDHVRKRNRNDSYMSEKQMEDAVHPDSAEMVVTKLSIESAVKQMIAELTPLQRTVFLLREVFGYKASEVRACLGMSEVAIKAALFRARRKLKGIQEESLQGMKDIFADEVQNEIFHAYLGAIRNGDIATLITLGQLHTLHPTDATIQVLALTERQIRARRSAQNDCTNQVSISLHAA